MNSKAKALFFAQYLNQKVYQHNDWAEFNDDRCMEVDSTYLQEGSTRLHGGWLLLRSIDSLTDEEVIVCGTAGFHFFDCSGFKLKVIRELSKISLAAITDNGKNCLVKIEINNPFKITLTQIDYLRSIGILLPFTYLNEQSNPITLTTQQIVDAGWAKYQTP